MGQFSLKRQLHSFAQLLSFGEEQNPKYTPNQVSAKLSEQVIRLVWIQTFTKRLS